MTPSRNAKPQGLAHRARIAAMYLPRLAPGTRLPPSALVGRWLGICQQEAYRHVRRALTEAGVATVLRGRRIYVAETERRLAP
jgi:hypothetical protein